MLTIKDRSFLRKLKVYQVGEINVIIIKINKTKLIQIPLTVISHIKTNITVKESFSPIFAKNILNYKS